MAITRTTYECGIVALCADDLDAAAFARELARAARDANASIASIFYSQDRFDPERLAAEIAEAAPDLDYAACSTAGEITPAGYSEGHVLAMLFPDDRFTAAAVLIEQISTTGIDSIVGHVDRLRRQVQAADDDEDAAMFGVLLVDGLSRAEEAVTSALYWSLHDIPLVGGSAGDDLHFEKTTLILNGQVRSDCAIVILVRSHVPFQVFKTENFVPTDKKLVVTASDPDRRTVHEFNAEPAAQAYADAIGLDTASLTPMSFASHPVVVRVGGEYFCRSIQKLNPDGSLTFFCAIDNGIVLTIAQPKGMVDSTREKLRQVEAELGGIDVVLGFDCVLRRLDAENRQNARAVSDLYRDHRVIGFGTYGEQYRSMHLNQTFTGIAFGRLARWETAA